MHEAFAPVSGPAGQDHRASDQLRCAIALKKGSQSFNAAAMLLPRRVRQPAQSVYAWCRACDDLVDNGSDPGDGVAQVSERLNAIYRDQPMDFSEDRAFHGAARRYRIPRRLPQALVEGFVWDAENRRYRDGDALLAYAARVAGTVGVMMAMLMDVRDRTLFARAAELGLAMQLTNVARDVGEDARHGRVYLPTEWLVEEGITPESLVERPVFTPGLGRVVRRLLALADSHYNRGISGVQGLPIDCRLAIGSAARIYRAIGAEIAANGYDSVNRRAATSAATKITLVVTALPYLMPLRRVEHGAPCYQISGLVDAASSAMPQRPTGFDAKAERFLELLEQSGRGALTQPSGFGRTIGS